MSKLPLIFRSPTVNGVMLVVLGIILGSTIFKTSSSHHHTSDTLQVSDKSLKTEIWTCSMHPQIKKDKSGKCPICGMDLIPLSKETSAVDTNAITFSKEAIALGNISTSIVGFSNSSKKIRLYGKVVMDERLIERQTAHFSGRIENLLVSYTGQLVKKGDVLATIYSPDLIEAQQELLEAVKIKSSYPDIYAAAQDRLHHWKLSMKQIEKIEASGVIQNHFELLSNTSGVVITKLVSNGDHIQEGSTLYEVADLSTVWVEFEAYENDIPYLHVGDHIGYSFTAIPDQSFTSTIKFIDPLLNAESRTAKIRVEVSNPKFLIKPQMYTYGIVQTQQNTKLPQLIIPSSAVLWTGKRSLVYIKNPNTENITFKINEIELGPKTDAGYVILSGLKVGDEIATEGTFVIDAAAQLEGKPSMLNQK